METVITFLTKAKEAGCPPDQIENFLRAGYLPQPKQLLFHSACRSVDEPGPNEVGFGGSRGPGKSHAMFAQMALDDCQRYPGLKCLMLRKVGKALRESSTDLRQKLLRSTPHKYNKSTGTTTFPNGSRILLGHFRTESDIDNYVGLEYDVIGIEECTTLSGQKYRLIGTCCRTSKQGWRPRMYSNANPGGIGHQFYYRHFINQIDNSQKHLAPIFVKATCRDNVFLDPDYIRQLESLTGWLRAAWLEGDWNVHAGTYFTTFNVSQHVVEPYEVDQLGWTFYLICDYGWSHPTAFLLLGLDNKRDIHVIDEYAASRRLPESHHAKVLEMLAKWSLGTERIRTFVMGTDAWKPNEKGVTVADNYKQFGWDPQRAKMNRIPGAMEILRRFGDVGIAPTLWIFSGCAGLIEQIPQMQHDPHNTEDVLKVNVDEEGYGGDDYYDTLRYGVMHVADAREVTYGSIWVPR